MPRTKTRTAITIPCMKALFVVACSSRLRSQDAAAVVLPLAQEGGRDNREGESRDNLDGKIDCRGRHGVFEVQ